MSDGRLTPEQLAEIRARNANVSVRHDIIIERVSEVELSEALYDRAYLDQAATITDLQKERDAAVAERDEAVLTMRGFEADAIGAQYDILTLKDRIAALEANQRTNVEVVKYACDSKNPADWKECCVDDDRLTECLRNRPIKSALTPTAEKE